MTGHAVDSDGPSDTSPTAAAHAKLQDALLLWRNAAREYFAPDAFRTYLNACIQALRNATWALQRHKDGIPDFDVWYAKWQQRLAADPVTAWLKEARNQVVKRGELRAHSRVRVAVVAYYHDLPFLEIDVDPFATIPDIVSKVSLERLPAEVLEDGFLRIERRWVSRSLPTHELLDALARAFGVLSLLVAEADRRIDAPSAIPSVRQGTEDAPSLEAYAQYLAPPMKGPAEFRTVCVTLSNQDVIHLRRHRLPLSPPPPERYGDIRFHPPKQMGAASLHETCTCHFEMAKRLMAVDGYHVPIVFLFLPNGGLETIQLQFDEQVEKYLTWEAVAADVERTDAEALVSIGEFWAAPHDPSHPLRRAGNSPGRTEALSLHAISRDGKEFSLSCPIIRTATGIELGDTVEIEDGQAAFFEPIRRTWARRRAATAIHADQPELLSEFWESMQIRNIELDSVSAEALGTLLSEAEQQHHLDGSALASDPPVLLFRLGSEEDARVMRQLTDPSLQPSPIGMLIWPWRSQFGGLLTITVMGKIPGASVPSETPLPMTGACPRVCLTAKDQAFHKMKAGTFIGVFAHSEEPLGAVEVTFRARRSEANPLDSVLSKLSSHKPVLDDSIAAYWDVLVGLRIYERHVTTEDRLSFGWVREYRRCASIFATYLDALRKGFDRVNVQTAGLSTKTAHLLDIVRDKENRPETLLQILAKLDSLGRKQASRGACAGG